MQRFMFVVGGSLPLLVAAQSSGGCVCTEYAPSHSPFPPPRRTPVSVPPRASLDIQANKARRTGPVSALPVSAAATAFLSSFEVKQYLNAALGLNPDWMMWCEVL